MVWKTALRLVDNEADGADCFQRTFVSALELSRTQEIRNWPGLLKRLATTRALECLRQRRRASSRLAMASIDTAIDRKEVGPVRAAEASELAEQLRIALTDLDHRQAQVFCLACLDGIAYQEIAEQLGITVNHVGVLLTRAKAGLRERLHAFRPAGANNVEREVQS